MTGWSRRTTEPRATRKGTTRAKTPGGVASSSSAPATLPTAATGSSRTRSGRVPASSLRELSADPGPMATAATMFPTLAGSGGTPAASSAG